MKYLPITMQKEVNTEYNMSTTITNNIVVINDEGDATEVLQTTIISITINQTLLSPVLLTYSPTSVSITRKTIDPVIITVSV